MASKKNESCVELYDVATKEKVAEAPLAEIKFLPRAGERIFIPLQKAGDWKSFDVISVEYFLGYYRSTGKPSRSVSAGVGRITLYVEPSKAAHARVDSP
jgi:hypothetical protein